MRYAYAKPFSLVFLFLFLFLFLSPSHSASKVNLSLYYESLCPYSQKFIVNQLVKVFESDLASIINLQLIPWGNAHNGNNSWTCQHGPNESSLIRLKRVPFICGLLRQNQWQSCLSGLKLNQELMNQCYSSATGTQLELRHANDTDHLQPPHRFVAWVVVNNKALQDDYRNYITYICQAYSGQNRPAACNNTQPDINSPSENANSVPQVCYPSEHNTVNVTRYNKSSAVYHIA